MRARAIATSLVVILLTALAVRLAYAWDEQRKIPRVDLATAPFLYEPGWIAYSLATGKGFSSPFRLETGPTAFMTPLYPLVLAGIFEIFGTFTFSAFIAAVLLNILFSALTCVPLFYAGKRLGGVGLGAGAAWLWALFPNAVIIPFQWIWDASLAGLLVATIVWATLVLTESGRARDWCAYGVLWGFALMTNATLLCGLPFLIVWMAYRRRIRVKDRGWLMEPAVACGVALLCCLPWTIRNYAVLHAFVPLRSALGLQLWLGNNDQYRGTFPGWLHPIDNPIEREKYKSEGEIAYMREKEREAVRWMVSHPAREAEMFGERFVATWAGTSHPLRDFRRTPSLTIRVIFAVNVFAALGALGGIVILIRRDELRQYVVPVAVFPLLYPLAYYFSFASFRYRYPIDPMILLLTVLLLGKLVRRIYRPGFERACASVKNAFCLQPPAPC